MVLDRNKFIMELQLFWFFFLDKINFFSQNWQFPIWQIHSMRKLIEQQELLLHRIISDNIALETSTLYITHALKNRIMKNAIVEWFNGSCQIMFISQLIAICTQRSCAWERIHFVHVPCSVLKVHYAHCTLHAAHLTLSAPTNIVWTNWKIFTCWKRLVSLEWIEHVLRNSS